MNRTFSRWLLAFVLLASPLSLFTGCGTGVSTEPAGDAPKEETPTQEYIEGEKAIQ